MECSVVMIRAEKIGRRIIITGRCQHRKQVKTWFSHQIHARATCYSSHRVSRQSALMMGEMHTSRIAVVGNYDDDS